MFGLKKLFDLKKKNCGSKHFLSKEVGFKNKQAPPKIVLKVEAGTCVEVLQSGRA